jgi:hypothetical protein
MNQQRAGVRHARDLGFLHISRLADVAWQAMLWEGHQPKARRPQPPLEMLATFLSASPLPTLSPRDLAVFLPEKRSATVRNGVLTASVGGDVHQFCNPELFAGLAGGTRLDYAFDPDEPTLGAALYTERGLVGRATYLPAGPVISARDRSQDDGPQILKRYKSAHRTEGRFLDLATLRTVKVSEARQMPVAPRHTQTADRRNIVQPFNPRDVLRHEAEDALLATQD